MSGLLQRESVSVVIGSYNSADWIRTTLESILNQTYPVAEIVIVDDGSTDETAEIATSFGSSIRFLREDHRGRPHRNQGIEASRGAFIAFIDADDCWHASKLERQLRRMREAKACWVACEAEWLDSRTGRAVPSAGMELVEGDILEPLFLHNFIVASTTVVSRDVIEAVGGFDEGPDVAPMEDWDLWLRIAARYPLACVRERLATLRLHGDSFLASTPPARRVQSLENIINRAAAREPTRLAPIRAAALHNAYFAAGVGAFRKNHRRDAQDLFAKAWRQRPLDVAALAYIGLCWLPWLASARLRSVKNWLGRGG